MTRIFDEHVIRRVRSLDGAWHFRKDPLNCGKETAWFLGIPRGETVAVPSVWNTEQGNLNYEGVAWYEKHFYSEGGCLRLCFGAVMTEAEVWLDGNYLGSHYGGFSQFDFIVSDVAAGEHRLTVRVDNRFDADSIPQEWVDWYHYGGITRGVSVETLQGICVLCNRLEYTLSEDLKSATGQFVLELYNAGAEQADTEVNISLGGTLVSTGVAELSAGARKEVTLSEFTLENVALWNVGAPELYDVRITTATDDLCDRVGFRKIEVKDGAVLLNGKPVEFRGVNRHEEHPDWGFAFPFGLMKKDIDLALEMGCNAIRGSHYPNSQEFVDLLDERGLMFWSEIPIWGCGFSDEALANETVVRRGLEMHREMVKYYYNHPCIVLWGMHNEIHSYHEAAYRMSKLYYEYLKENGGNRLVVYASCHPLKDICFEFSDLICLNQYFGWYYGYEDDAWEKFLAEFCEHIKTLGMAHKPIVMSEFGCAAIAGCHDDENILWCEENQAKQIAHCLKVFHEHPQVAGSFIWQFFDMRTCLQAGLNRARGFNNKGLMNEYRKPKLAYRAAKELYHEFAAEETDRFDFKG
ncbi:MAG: beta-glucuronidase [Clostridia bacterium]|nr:beta-glucuronidase [Clostridia bacterium]